MRAVQAAGLVGLAAAAAGPGGSWVDPMIALGVAGWSVWEGTGAWRGEGCG